MPSSTSPLRRGVLTVAAIGLTCAVTAPSAMAVPSDPVYPSAQQVQSAKDAAKGKAGQVAAIESRLAAASARLDAIETEAEVASEKYNGAKMLLDQRTAAAADAAAKAATAAKAAAVANGRVGNLAAQTYMQGGNLGGLEAFLSDGGPQQILDQASGLAVLGGIRTQALQQASAARAIAGELLRAANRSKAQQLAAAQAAQDARDAAGRQAQQAQVETAAIARSQGALVAQLAALQNTSVQLAQQRQDGLAAEARRREEARVKAALAKAQAAAAAKAAAARSAAAAKAAAAAKKNRSTKKHSNTTHHSSPPPTVAPRPRHKPSPPQSTSGGVSAVIAYARAQIGKWYEWAAAGPSRFDCSGLTMMAWRQAGVYMGHYTGSQYDAFPHVSVHSLRPGDLVFFGPSVPGIHHVGLYIGGGMMIEAPHTGAQVRYGSIWRSDLISYGVRP